MSDDSRIWWSASVGDHLFANHAQFYCARSGDYYADLPTDAVLLAHQPPAQAPITADDVLAAERAWWLSDGVTDASRAAFVAEWLNRARTEPTTGETT